MVNWDVAEQFATKLKDILKCEQCYETSMNPVVLLSCQHSFCSQCLSSNTTCPKCGLPSKPADVRPDNITIELSSTCQDLLKFINNEQQKISSNSGSNFSADIFPSIEVNTVETVKLNIKDKFNRNNTRRKSTSKRIGEIGRPKPVFKRKGGDCTEKKSDSTLHMPPFSPLPNGGQCASNLRLTTQSVSGSLSSAVPATPPAINTSVKKSQMKLMTPNTRENNGNKTRLLPPLTPRLDKRNSKGETVLHVACVKGEQETVRKLLSEGANPNSRDHAGWTPLHEACQHGHVSIVSLLLEGGALPDVPGWEGNATPLHDAVEHGKEMVIRVLRKNGARDDIRDMYGRTPRDLASLCQGPAELLSALDTPADTILPGCRAPPTQQSMVLTASNLAAEHTKQLTAFAKKNKIKLVHEYSSDVSHVIVRCEQDRHVCLRTAKFMMGVVAGKWILSHKWLLESQARSVIAPPDQFEVTGSSQNATSGAPARARENANKMMPGLLSGCNIYLHGNFSVNCPSKRDLEGLVRAGGAKLLLREPNPENIPTEEKTVPFHAPLDSPLVRCSHIIIYQEGSETEPQLKYDMAHIKTMPLSWLIDCIDHFRLLPPFEAAL